MVFFFDTHIIIFTTFNLFDYIIQLILPFSKVVIIKCIVKITI